MRRITYLDGLRGIAALQVVLQHYIRAFAPASAGRLGFAADGDAAVFLFFLMSGFVLTPSFGRRPGEVATNFARRVVRLGVPTLAASLIAVTALPLAQDLVRVVAQASGSWWLSINTGPNSLPDVLKEVTGFSMIAGYANTGLFPLPHLSAVQKSADPPFWTLHIELWGSALVLLLVWASEVSAVLYGFALACSALVLGVNALILFMLGHLCWGLVQGSSYTRAVEARAASPLGVLLIVTGIVICTLPSPVSLAHLRSALPTGVLRSFEWFSFRKEIGAIAIFSGVLIAPPVQACLDCALPRILGRLSFSIYLLHWPVMVTVGCGVYLAALPVGHRIAALLAFIVGMAVTFPAASLFERWCDQPAVSASRKIKIARFRIRALGR